MQDSGNDGFHESFRQPAEHQGSGLQNSPETSLSFNKNLIVNPVFWACYLVGQIGPFP